MSLPIRGINFFAGAEILFMAKKYSKGAQKSVKRAMHEKKKGTLQSGRSGKKVTSRKQAIAIGLSEARKKGAKVPSPKRSRKTAKKTGRSAKKRSTAKRSASRKRKSR
jgi:hypothetical protein